MYGSLQKRTRRNSLVLPFLIVDKSTVEDKLKNPSEKLSKFGQKLKIWPEELSKCFSNFSSRCEWNIVQAIKIPNLHND